MTSNALAAWLLQASAWLAIALLPPLLLRVPLRRLLGAGIAYAAWLLPPVIIVAALLPAAASSPLSIQVAWQSMPALAPVPSVVPVARGMAGLVVMLWVGGMLLYALMLRTRHSCVLWVPCTCNAGCCACAHLPPV